MLVVEREHYRDDFVRNLCEQVPSGSLLVVNDTRVRRSRVLGRRRGTGGKVELLLLNRSSASATTGRDELWVALGRPMRVCREGSQIDADGLAIQVHGRDSNGHLLVRVTPSSDEGDVEAALECFGHVPIPPYLGREDEPSDATRYQTVYANRRGSVAAPTAGLHLTAEALERLRIRGVEVGSVTLHVGIGTFRPVAVEDLDDHPMHSEWFEVAPELVSRVSAARARGSRVYAVGTTAVRALESAADPLEPGHIRAVADETKLLIQPGYEFRVVDGLLTNFHQPRSTLLALVSAAIGVERVREAYRAAIERGYRFLSYGDAMWIPELER